MRGDNSATSAVLARFEDRAPTVRQAAVKAMPQFVEYRSANALCSKRMIIALGRRLEDRESDVRLAAVESLARVAKRCCDHAVVHTVIATAVPRLRHVSGGVRLVAILVLSQVAMKGNDQIIAVVAKCLQDTDCDVRQAAVKAMASVAEEG